MMKSLHDLVARLKRLGGVEITFEESLPVINNMPLVMEFDGTNIRVRKQIPDKDKLWLISHAYGHCYQWSVNPISRDEDPAELPQSAAEFIDILSIAFDNEKRANEVGFGSLIRVTDFDTFQYCIEKVNLDWKNFANYLCEKYSLRYRDFSMLTGLDFKEKEFSPVRVRPSGAYLL